MMTDKLTLHTEGWFDASHHLNNYDGACKNLHGHTYKCEVWVKGSPNRIDKKTGILWDFGKLKKVLETFDHNGDLTENMGINSTAENQCLLIYNTLKKGHEYLMIKVRLYEQVQPKESWCEYGDW